MKAAGREFGGHGSCRARSVVVKVVAAPYESARVVADIPSRTPLRDVRVAFIGDVSDSIRNEVADAGAPLLTRSSAEFVVCGDLSSDGSMVIEKTAAFRAAFKRDDGC